MQRKHFLSEMNLNCLMSIRSTLGTAPTLVTTVYIHIFMSKKNLCHVQLRPPADIQLSFEAKPVAFSHPKLRSVHMAVALSIVSESLSERWAQHPVDDTWFKTLHWMVPNVSHYLTTTFPTIPSRQRHFT